MDVSPFSNSKFLWRAVFWLAILVYFVGALVMTMEIDGAVYAEISREMAHNGNFLELFLKGKDWLDKPHFQFWATAISFKILGINSFAYKLPAILCMLLGVRYTFLFGKRFYSAKHGHLAAILLMTAQHIITSNTDVRAEPYLVGLTAFALYYLAAYLDDKKFWHLVAGSFGLACLLMTKGLFTILPVAAGLGLSLLYNRKWKEIVHWQWLAVVGLTLLFISPLLYGYYVQFDAHPEKVVFDHNGVSGIKFFLWDSQWGRFTNTGPIKGSGDPTFFLHTLLWAYMPWAFLAYFALPIKGKKLWKKADNSESYTFFGFTFLFIVFSISRFQLPHYLNALFPLLSIVTADALFSFAKNRRFLQTFYHIHVWSSVLLMVAVLLLQFTFSDQSPAPDVYLVFLAGFGLITVLLTAKGQKFKKLIFVPAIAILLVNYYLNRAFYPQLLKYQAESEVALYMKKYQLEGDNLVVLGLREEMISFLQDRLVPLFPLDGVAPSDLEGRYVFTNQAGIDKMQKLGLSIQEISSFEDFRITTLNGTFLNKHTRGQAVEIKYLLKVDGVN